MINGTFYDVMVDQYGKDAGDDEMDKTWVECWHMSELELDKKIPTDQNLPFSGDGEHMYQDVRTGSIVQNPSEIRLQE